MDKPALPETPLELSERVIAEVEHEFPIAAALHFRDTLTAALEGVPDKAVDWVASIVCATKTATQARFKLGAFAPRIASPPAPEPIFVRTPKPQPEEIPPHHKRCTGTAGCGEIRPVSSFYKKGEGYAAICKACWRDAYRPLPGERRRRRRKSPRNAS